VAAITFVALEKLIAFYVEQNSTVVPHAAFAGQTPDEMYFGRGPDPAGPPHLPRPACYRGESETSTSSAGMKA
jgi:hypothetical protein